MHNNIMVAGSRDRPPMLATGRYAQWQSRFLRYIDTRPNGDALRKCILEGPYTPSTVIISAVPATDNSPAFPERTTVETILNISLENKAHYELEKEAIYLLLTGIGGEIYSTDVKTNLFWEFGKFISHDGETMESYYIRFYKMMNELIRNNLTVATMQVNVQFFQQLQPEWSRFVTIVMQQHKLDEVSYHKLFDILKQYPKEVNEIHPYYQTPKSHKSYAPTSKALPPTISHATTRHKGKEIAKPITPPSESTSKEDSDPEQAQKGSQVVQQIRIQCFNCKEFGHFAKECMKPKRVKDFMYHKEKMLLCKQAEKGVPLQAEQSDWLADTDDGINEQELEAHYSF
ncbi:integrase, catalytic region, zinc finger, CCHC-type containing protein [Tanacetum coccineum]